MLNHFHIRASWRSFSLICSAIVLVLWCTVPVGSTTLASPALAGVQPGYTLVSPLFGTETILLNQQNQTVHSWKLNHESGGAAYLLENGDLLQTGNIDSANNFAPAVKTGGGGYIDRYSWDGTLVWEYELHTETQLQHHDIEPMPNGNVMLTVYESIAKDKALADGRSADKMPPDRNDVWSEALLEIDPKTNQTVWEWHVWDHLIQDANPDKGNYGDPAAHPELIDVNYGYDFPNYTDNITTNVEWLHANSVNYNPTLDQIMLSARQFNEVWIIDHSTTTAESASHSGGKYGKGGDLLFRWGNPAAYRAGDPVTDRVLYFQHDARWIPDGLPGAGHMTVFDDGSYQGRPTSRALEVDLKPNLDGSYNLPAKEKPAANIVWQYQISTEYSFILGGTQRLANGNTLITDGYHSRIMEVTPDGQTVWDWKTPDGSYLFRADRYSLDYPAFAGKDLTPIS